jgi:hypothetical protein
MVRVEPLGSTLIGDGPVDRVEAPGKQKDPRL